MRTSLRWLFRNEVSTGRQTIDRIPCRKLENPAHCPHNTSVPPLTFGDQYRATGACLAAAACLLSNSAAAQQPPGQSSQPAVAFPDAPGAQPNQQPYPTNPQAPPPPPPPPPYASQTPSGPPPAYGSQPAPGAAPSGYPPGPPPNVAPAPAPQPYPNQPPPAYPPQAYPPPQQPAYPPPAQPYPPPQTQPGVSQQPTYASGAVETPAGTGQSPSRLEIPDFSVRIDPLNWVVEGQLGFEIEVEALEWLTIETVPRFVMAHEPLTLPDNIRQYSNGLGPLAGASLSAGFWLEGDSFRGTVIRAGLTRYGYRYASIAKKGERTEGQPLDEASLTQTRLTLMLGSGRRFGYFTLGGGFGIEYELFDRERQCLERPSGPWEMVTKVGCDSREFLLRRRESEPDAANLRSFLFPLEFVFRFSVGVVFDD